MCVVEPVQLHCTVNRHVGIQLVRSFKEIGLVPSQGRLGD